MNSFCWSPGSVRSQVMMGASAGAMAWIEWIVPLGMVISPEDGSYRLVTPFWVISSSPCSMVKISSCVRWKCGGTSNTLFRWFDNAKGGDSNLVSKHSASVRSWMTHEPGGIYALIGYKALGESSSLKNDRLSSPRGAIHGSFLVTVRDIGQSGKVIIQPVLKFDILKCLQACWNIEVPKLLTRDPVHVSLFMTKPGYGCRDVMMFTPPRLYSLDVADVY
jgi:hypothetical protein